MLGRFVDWVRARCGRGAKQQLEEASAPVEPLAKPEQFLLFRALDLPLWMESVEGWAEGEVPATTVQHKDFKATKNTLSFWRFKADHPRRVEDAVLAIVGGMKRIDGLHLVWLPEESLSPLVSLATTKGITCFTSLVPFHVDAEQLDGRRLAAVAEKVAAAARAQQTVSKTRDEVLDIVVDAVTTQRLMRADNLPKELKEPVLERLRAQRA